MTHVNRDYRPYRQPIRWWGVSIELGPHIHVLYTPYRCMYKADDRLLWLKAMTLQILRGQQHETEERNCHTYDLHLYLTYIAVLSVSLPLTDGVLFFPP